MDRPRRPRRTGGGLDGVLALDERRDEADGAPPVLVVDQIRVALGARVKLTHVSDAEALDELLPHVWPQAIPDRGSDRVRAVVRPRRRRAEVSADLSDVQHDGGAQASAVGEELAGRESAPQEQRQAERRTAKDADEHGGGVGRAR